MADFFLRRLKFAGAGTWTGAGEDKGYGMTNERQKERARSGMCAAAPRFTEHVFIDL